MSCILPFTLIIFAKFEVDLTIYLLSYNILAADRLCDLVTLTFDFLILDSGHTW